jgi:plasmid stability protein
MAKSPKAITLRNLPEPVARAVRERAAKYHVSLNKAVIQLLEEAMGASGPPYHDLDHLAGSWSKEQADEFDRLLAEQRRIDPEDWK